MKKVLILLFVCLLVFSGCSLEDVEQEKAEEEPLLWGLTEKEIEAVLDIINRPYSEGYTLDDVEEIIRIGYDEMYVNGEWIENKNMIEYKVILKNGETRLVSINKILLD